MHHENKKILEDLIAAFISLSQVIPYKNMDSDIDDMLARFLRAELGEDGKKRIAEITHEGKRTRKFTYKSEDGQTEVSAWVVTVLGDFTQAKFHHSVRFTKKKQPTTSNQ
ncbi:hypothetical protein H7X65_01565 [Candidatus Parcubacteria bacterium]|nr:hypothetical protein [Candidatus Parcubacteria bacterium]